MNINNEQRPKKYITNVGLITSSGFYSHNIMAAEWTYQIAPGLLLVSIGSHKATAHNIMQSKEFGVNLAASDQNFVASIAGGNSGKEVDKIGVLKKLGVEFYNGSSINTLMVKGAALNAECKLKNSYKAGNYTIFIGEIQRISTSDKMPLIYNNGKYWNFGSNISKPKPNVMKQIDDTINIFRK